MFIMMMTVMVVMRVFLFLFSVLSYYTHIWFVMTTDPCSFSFIVFEGIGVTYLEAIWEYLSVQNICGPS